MMPEWIIFIAFMTLYAIEVVVFLRFNDVEARVSKLEGIQDEEPTP